MGLISNVAGAATDIAGGLVSNTIRRLGFGGDFAFLSDPAHAKSTYTMDTPYMEVNTPRMKFQFLVVFNFGQTEQLQDHVRRYFPIPQVQTKVNELVKRVDMPSMSIDTEVLNQYNKKRISQKKINFNPINLVMHDVVDGKTLKFWEMYYEYYFKDGVTSIQQRKVAPPPDQPQYQSLPNANPQEVSDVKASNDPIAFAKYQSEVYAEKRATEAHNQNLNSQYATEMTTSADNTRSDDILANGKRVLQSGKLNKSEFRDDIVQNEFASSYGFNLDRVANDRYMIESMDIYQFHGGKFSKVSLIHPRISDFKHDTLSQEDSSMSELNFTFEYEDAVYLNRSDEIEAEVLAYLIDTHYLEIESLTKHQKGLLSKFADAIGLGGIIGENSVLGSTLSSALGLVGDQLPAQYINAATSSIFGGGLVPYPDPSAALKNIGQNAIKNATGSVGTSFASTAKSVFNQYIP